MFWCSSTRSQVKSVVSKILKKDAIDEWNVKITQCILGIAFGLGYTVRLNRMSVSPY